MVYETPRVWRKSKSIDNKIYGKGVDANNSRSNFYQEGKKSTIEGLILGNLMKIEHTKIGTTNSYKRKEAVLGNMLEDIKK